MSKVMAELELDKQIKEHKEMIVYACTKAAVNEQWITHMLNILLKMQEKKLKDEL